MIDSSPCLNRSDRRLDMINPVILLARCCKSLKFAFSGCFTMLAGIWLGFSIRWLESPFFGVSGSVFLLFKLEWKPCDCPPFFVLFVACCDVGMLVYLFNRVFNNPFLKLSDLVYSSFKTPKRFLNSASSITGVFLYYANKSIIHTDGRHRHSINR